MQHGAEDGPFGLAGGKVKGRVGAGARAHAAQNRLGAQANQQAHGVEAAVADGRMQGQLEVAARRGLHHQRRVRVGQKSQRPRAGAQIDGRVQHGAAHPAPDEARVQRVHAAHHIKAAAEVQQCVHVLGLRVAEAHAVEHQQLHYLEVPRAAR